MKLSEKALKAAATAIPDREPFLTQEGVAEIVILTYLRAVEKERYENSSDSELLLRVAGEKTPTPSPLLPAYLTKREWFVGQAIGAALTIAFGDSPMVRSIGTSRTTYAARLAIVTTDELMELLSKGA